MNSRKSAGVSWGGRPSSATQTWPTVVFPATDVLPGYLGTVHATSMGMQAGRPVNVARYEGDELPRQALCVLTPTPLGSEKDKGQAQLEKEALFAAEACCIIVEKVPQLSANTCLDATTRKKVRMLVFHGEKSDVATKAIGILFPHLRKTDIIFRPETENIPHIAERILALAAAI